MYIIDKQCKEEIIIKNSKFIANIISLNNIDEINNILNKIRNDYQKATHYCYAYIFNYIKKFNDDNYFTIKPFYVKSIEAMNDKRN